MSVPDQLPADVAALFTAPNLAHVATLMRDGSPHVAPVWVEHADGLLRFAKEEESIGLRNLERDPRVALSATAFDDPYAVAKVRGTAVEFRRGGDAGAWLDAMSIAYTGAPWPGELPSMVLISVAPQRAHVYRSPAFTDRIVATFAVRSR
jgi:PPOX class probable F420-dependent enzyme